MSRPLRVGDRVTETGTVWCIDSLGMARVDFDGDGAIYKAPSDLTLIEPAEPPVGSVVVKDGTAYLHEFHDDVAWTCATDGQCHRWSDLSDGEVIFTPGGGA